MGKSESVKKDIEWVMARRNRSHGLLPMRRALAQANDPQDAIRCVHIAGTNGKGSTTNYLKDILMAAGYTIGTFTSPHLEHHCDRIRINGEWIQEETFLAYLKQYEEVIEEEDLGMFEIDVLISFSWFRDMHVDYALIETGLGGRLDNTNVITKPILEVITTIGFDHMNILGERIQQIAFEKAGIIMPYTQCVIGNVDPACKAVIGSVASRQHASISQVRYRDMDRNTFEYRRNLYHIQGASYQKANAALALHAAWTLGIDINALCVKEAVYQSAWAGRFEMIAHDPDTIVDGAHNEEGVRALCASLNDLKRPLTIVFSALADKEGKKMAGLLEPCCDTLIITRFENSRSAKQAQKLSEHSIVEENWQKAIETARKQSAYGTVVITGSLYFVSIVRDFFKVDGITGQ